MVESGKFDWAASGKFPSLTEPEPAYHGLRFYENFGDFAFTTKARAVALRDFGPTMAPMNAFLTITGIETLHVRMERHCANAQEVARISGGASRASPGCPMPGWKSSPYHALARKYLPKGAGSVFTFGVKGGYEAGVKLVESVRLFSHLANIGDTRSLILHPASTTHRQLTDEQRAAAGAGQDVIRLSIGLEDGGGSDRRSGPGAGACGMMELVSERVLILDFGSQVTQLIARRLRESGVYCEIWPFNADPARIAAWRPRGIILSGGPATVHEAAAPLAPDEVFELGVPVLGICYGEQLLCQQLGGEVQASDHREFGRAFVDVTGDCALFHGVWADGRARAGVDEPRRPGDAAAAGVPRGRRRARARRSPPSPTTRGGSTACSSIRRWCTRRTARAAAQFHPWRAGLSGTWTMAGFRATEIARIRAQVGQGRVICGLSGGVEFVGRRGADP